MTPPAPLAVTALSAPAPGGIGSVVLWGPRAGRLIRELIPALRPGVPRYRTLREGEQFVDEVVALLVPAHQAPTGQEEGEIYFHGGRAAHQEVLGYLKRRGAQQVPPAVYVEHFRRFDRIQKEALLLLPEAVTLRACTFLLRQLGGELSRVLRGLTAEKERLCERLEELERSYVVGRCLVRGIRAVVVGPPNAGKSTLVNRLSGSTRSIVTPIPGTTRDLLEAETEVAGFPLTLIDGAGLQEGGSVVERLGSEKVRQSLGSADVVLCLGIDPEDLPCRVRRSIRLGPKADLGGVFPPQVLPVSGLTGLGVEELLRRTLSEAVGFEFKGKLTWQEEALPDPACPFTERQARLLRQAHRAAQSGGAEAAGRFLAELVGRPFERMSRRE